MVNAGITKTQVYYPRPRSYSAGSQNASLPTNKRLSSPISTPTSTMKVMRMNSSSSSKMYGRTKSVEEGKKALASPTTSSQLRYKTELCRPYMENGFCKYGDKCQFAHGEQDLRSLPRHPKYKTELCRTYHTRGFCPYGSRCHFIHNVDETKKSQENFVVPKSPMKQTFSFTIPISPCLDSGISSPDDFQRGRYFEFPGNDHHSSGSGSEVDYGDFDHSPEQDIGYCPSFGGQEPVTSPDPFELDSLSLSSNSPSRPLNEDFCVDVCSDLFAQINLEECPSQGIPTRTSSCHLPVFDNMLSSKTDSTFLDREPNNKVNPFSFFSS